MTEAEWNHSDPAQAEAYLVAWTNHQKREDYRCSAIQFMIAQTASTKKLKFADFLPEYAKPKKRGGVEDMMREVEVALAKQAARKPH